MPRKVKVSMRSTPCRQGLHDAPVPNRPANVEPNRVVPEETPVVPEATTPEHEELYEGPKLNYTFGKADVRDYKYKAHVTEIDEDTLPESVDLREHWGPIFDQGDLGSCVANAVSGAIRATRKKNGMTVYDPSRLFIYYFARTLDGTDPEEDAGTYIRSGFKAVNKFKVCSERNWPYKVSEFSTEPSEVAQKAAAQHRTFTYLSLDGSPCEIKHAIDAGYPVVFGTNIYKSFMTRMVAKSGKVPIPDKRREELLGGHAMAIVGYDDTTGHYIVANSWGADWGDDGFCYIPYEYIHDEDLTGDFWSPLVFV